MRKEDETTRDDDDDGKRHAVDSTSSLHQSFAFLS